ncbi:uncharacterized protein [Aegilops tauschii subsp. strangulata]|uniref:uncharacterized protein n=1 Tax=Aegilops tauschii subsp. strangulata TaxID=200361 RepID=UPI003CC86903
MVVDALATILDRAKVAGHIHDVVPHLVGSGGVSMLQYANDTIIMMSDGPEDIANLNFLLLCFQQMPGLKINFDKSALMVMGYSPTESQAIADRLNCQLRSFPTTYPRIPISDSRLSVADLPPMVDKLPRRIKPWQGRWLSKAARTILIIPPFPTYSYSS